MNNPVFTTALLMTTKWGKWLNCIIALQWITAHQSKITIDVNNNLVEFQKTC